MTKTQVRRALVATAKRAWTTLVQILAALRRGWIRLAAASCRGLRALAWLVLAHVHPAEDEIDAAVRAAFADVGLGVHLYAGDFRLRDKRYEVLHFAARRLGYDFETVDDIKALLR